MFRLYNYTSIFVTNLQLAWLHDLGILDFFLEQSGPVGKFALRRSSAMRIFFDRGDRERFVIDVLPFLNF